MSDEKAFELNKFLKDKFIGSELISREFSDEIMEPPCEITDAYVEYDGEDACICFTFKDHNDVSISCNEEITYVEKK